MDRTIVTSTGTPALCRLAAGLLFALAQAAGCAQDDHKDYRRTAPAAATAQTPAPRATPLPRMTPAPAQPSGASTPSTATAASVAQASQRPEDNLRVRAERNWAARQHDDWPALFQFEDSRDDPGVTEQKFVEWSKANYPFVVHSFSIRDAIVDGDMGWVLVNCQTSARRFKGAQPVTVDRWEKWKRKNGEWIPVPDNQIDDYPTSPALRDAAAEARLRARFDASWQARDTADWPTYYTFVDPRNLNEVSYEKFAETHSLFDFRDCKVHWVENLKGSPMATVKVTVEHKLTDPSLTKAPPEIVTIAEKWVLVDGEWYVDLVPST